jgi:hypothetical protein
MPKKFFIPIPKGTKPGKCRSCPAVIYFAPHPTSGKLHPISIADPECFAPTAETDGQGVSHFSNCEFAKEHRRRK